MQPTCYRWQPPSSSDPEADKHRLRIFNSFTRKKELFHTNKPGKTIQWYTCGPTVYDVSHLGHACCYITFDIMRRILANYFGYDIFYVMNITDIDDKIIKKARSNYLCDQYIAKAAQTDSKLLVSELKLALKNYLDRRAHETDPAKLQMIQRLTTQASAQLDSLEALVQSGDHEQQLQAKLESLRDIIADEQDVKLAHTVTDHSIFKALTMHYEQDFHDDMLKLGVLKPNALTRVSDYIDEIGLYIRQIEQNGFAYRANGSVYFDTNRFDTDPRHSYAKLVREAFGQKKTLDEGEGELATVQQDEKRSPNDFALWKKSKSGEPSWITLDFEPGRPGWHIECSVMASDLLGECFDIHSGGWDLKFPHHDNEIAQAEAYYNTGKNWVNYFCHSGHLSISGCKMSKSLKNFITIKQALQDYTARQLRFAFLAHSWTETLDYSPNTMTTATSYEKTFREFFLNVADLARRQSGTIDNDKTTSHTKLCDQFRKWSKTDRELNHEFMQARNKIDIALCDNFDTRTVLNIMSALVREYNKLSGVDLVLAIDIGVYVHRILNIFGANFDDTKFDHIVAQANANQSSTNNKSNGGNNDEAVFKYVDALAKFRADIRDLSKSGDPAQSVKQILNLCDTLRDKILPTLGVRLEDKEIDNCSYVVKLVDPEILAKEKAMADRKEDEEKLRKAAAQIEKLKLQQQRLDKAKMPPQQMFRNQSDKYSQFDDTGMPTHDIEGKEISKSALKKLQRLYAEQETKYKKYLEDNPPQ